MTAYIQRITVPADEIIKFARGCAGVPFHHQGRDEKAGLDCVGLVVACLRRAGIEVKDRSDYGKRPDGETLLAEIVAHGAAKVEHIAPADLLLFRYDNRPQHVAIATDKDNMIHSFAPAGKVVETSIGAYWKRRLVGIYRFSFVEG